MSLEDKIRDCIKTNKKMGVSDALTVKCIMRLIDENTVELALQVTKETQRKFLAAMIELLGAMIDELEVDNG